MSAQELDRTFAALADETRRRVVDVLRKKPLRAGELARRFGLSAPAISRHLRVLREAGVVEEEGDGVDARVRMYRLKRRPFAELRRWVEDVEALWGAELEAFKAHVEKPR